MVMPTFLLIGAAKGGTTSLHYAFDQHPQIYMSPMKEPSFFWAYGQDVRLLGPGAEVMKHRYVDTLEDYQKLFAKAADYKARGESSVRYLCHPPAPKAIHQFLPDVKLIMILRQPAERAFSSFAHYRRDGMEPCADFAGAIAQDRQGQREGWTFGRYLSEGFYFQALQRYLAYFDRDQMHISLLEDLQADPQALMCSIFQFLGVDDSFVVDLSHQHNVSGIIRNPLLRWVWTRSNPLRAAIRPLLSERFRHRASELMIRDVEKLSLPPQLRAELTEYYRQDIEQLQDLLGRDLSHWLKGVPGRSSTQVDKVDR